MLHRPLGRSGLQVPVLGLAAGPDFGSAGGRSEARRLVGHAFESGIRLFDSPGGENGGEPERLLGDVLADLRLPRAAYLLCSHAGIAAPALPPLQRGLSRKPLRDACDAALKRLRVDYLDLFLARHPDPDTPLEETVAAMDQLVRTGKVLHWGVGEWPADALAEAARAAAEWRRPAASFVLAGVAPAGRESGLGWIAAAPPEDPPAAADDAAAVRAWRGRLARPEAASRLIAAVRAEDLATPLAALAALGPEAPGHSA